MRFIKPPFLVFLLVLVSAQHSFSQTEDETAVENFISEQAIEKKVEEYKYAREVLRADINADKTEDIVVLYTLSGFTTGIGYVRYLAVFIGDGEDFHYADHKSVSGIIERSIELKSVDDGTICLKTLEYFKKGDTHYTGIGDLKFTFTEGKLKEL